METKYIYRPEFLERLNRCSMPNLAAEIFFHAGGHPTTYADHANITMELLEAFLNGEEDITTTEFLAMASLNGNGADYLASGTLAAYRLEDRSNARKLKRIFSDCKKRFSDCDPDCIDVKVGLTHLEKLRRMYGQILRAEINKLQHHVYMAELDKRCKAEKANRRGRNPRTCSGKKKITAPDGNPEAVTGGVNHV